jgi:hypothetical protein
MDRKIIILCALAIPLGLAGGYGWSAMTAPAAHAKHPRKGTISHMPASPEEQPAALDTEWTVRSGGGAAARASEATGRNDSGCNDDGIACEPHRRG